MLGKEQWRASMSGNECRSNSLGNKDLGNCFEQERLVRFAVS